jgi:hypothetical protein|tara:strand:+ start:128 stop:403 length:276 start_codon:yes stop_codon:yes gene_type:complete
VLGSNQMTAPIEKVTDNSMSTRKSLSLAHRFEPPHPSLPYSGRLMGLLCSIILVLLSAVDRIGNQLTMRYTMISQFIRLGLQRATGNAAYR